MKRELIFQKELATLLDMEPRWVRDLERRGIFKKTVEKYVKDESVTSYVRFLRQSKNKELAAVQTKHLEIKTKKLELEAKQLEGSLVPRSEKEGEIARLVGDCESNFRDLPARLTPVVCQVAKMENEEKLVYLILKHGLEGCWRGLAGYPKNETPIILPGEMFLLSLGLIKGDKNGEVIVQGTRPRREKVSDLLQKYGSGVDSLKIPDKEDGENEKRGT